MSKDERTFIRQLKITLISVLGPFMLLAIASGVNDHFKIQNNTNHINALESSTVSREVLLLYVNDQREIAELLRVDINSHSSETDDQIAAVNSRLDQLMRDVFKSQPRGVPKEEKNE